MDALVWRSLAAVGRCATFCARLRLGWLAIEAFKGRQVSWLSLLPVSLSFVGGIIP